MSETVIIVGSSEQQIPQDKGAPPIDIEITSPSGDVIIVNSADIENTHPADSADELTRYEIRPGSSLYVKLDSNRLAEYNSISDTITKYLDDGGTISKSRDDL